jgi:hypothetical protein
MKATQQTVSNADIIVPIGCILTPSEQANVSKIVRNDVLRKLDNDENRLKDARGAGKKMNRKSPDFLLLQQWTCRNCGLRDCINHPKYK